MNEGVDKYSAPHPQIAQEPARILSTGEAYMRKLQADSVFVILCVQSETIILPCASAQAHFNMTCVACCSQSHQSPTGDLAPSNGSLSKEARTRHLPSLYQASAGGPDSAGMFTHAHVSA